MSVLKLPLMMTLAIGSAALAIYFWVEASELQSKIALAQEARDVADFNNLELQKRLHETRQGRPKAEKTRRVSCVDEQGERASRQLLTTMRRLSEREKEACRNVAHLHSELEDIRKEIHDSYIERNKYKRKIKCLEECAF